MPLVLAVVVYRDVGVQYVSRFLRAHKTERIPEDLVIPDSASVLTSVEVSDLRWKPLIPETATVGCLAFPSSAEVHRLCGSRATGFYLAALEAEAAAAGDALNERKTGRRAEKRATPSLWPEKEVTRDDPDRGDRSRGVR